MILASDDLRVHAIRLRGRIVTFILCNIAVLHHFR